MPWWLSLFLFAGVAAHVRLSFPSARSPALDYFSSANSQGPCGVPKPAVGEGIRTFLKAGSVIDVEWKMAIPHMGGIRLEVLNALDQPIALFTNFRDKYNISQTTKSVELPAEFECANCAIRLTHQATEYGNDYFFYSCADVNILKEIPDGDSCLSHGRRTNGKCQCEPGFTGSQCQYEEECRTGDDCGVQGVCKKDKNGAESECFCPSGRYGKKCEKESTVFRTLAEFDESLYNMREAMDNKIYWRLIEDEIEMVLRYPGQSWAAIGWKPTDAVCPTYTQPSSKMGKVSVTPTTFTSPPVSPTSSEENVVKVAVENESINKDTECGPNEQWTECPEKSRDCEASCDWTRFPETIPNCPRQCGAPRCVCKEGYVRMTNDEEACVPFEFCDKEAEPSCPSNSTWAKCGVACEPSCANMYDTAPCPASCEKADCTCADNYVRYNGQCIYWGDCPDLESHFHENVETVTVNVEPVSVDITPSTQTTTRRPATHRGGAISSCAVNETVNECGRVCEADCVTIFTRGECEGCGETECACLQGYARNADGNCVYWGDCPVQGSGLQTRAPTTPTTQAPRTTPKRELKLKVEGDVCYGEFRFPAGCSDCDYKLSWNYMEESDEIEFSLETRLAQNAWTGVGLNSDGSMVGADMLIVKSFNGQLSLHDMTSEGYGAPKEDDSQDLRTPNVIGTHENGVLRAQFIRKRNTGDDVDKQFDSECWKMMYPINGGKLDASGNITIHSNTPLISDRQVCIRSCHEQKKTQGPPSTCQTEFRYPAGCEDNECEYIAKWKYDSGKKDVQFDISSKNMGRWTGIGFSKTGQMANSDIYTGWVYENKAYVTDRFAYGRQLPAIDPADRQDIYDISGKMVDDMQTISFRRKVTTNDKLTDYPLDQCYYFMYPVGGGRVIAKKSSDFANPRTPIGYHDLYQPRVSAHKVCICDENGVSITRDATPTRVRVKRQAPRDPFGDNVETKNDIPTMACSDMIVASVKNGRARVQDMYSPSKATPRADSFFGGEETLTSAAAFQEDGITTVVFRRKLRSSDKFDHTISPGPMTVIWAKGVDADNYQHTTGGAPIKADPDFFAPGEFRYHGRNQRGSLSIDFFDDKKIEPTVHGMHLDTSTCSGKYAFPAGCEGEDCTYIMEWTSDGTVARFTIEANLDDKQWTGLGFSEDGLMAKSDVIIISIPDKEVSVTDQYMPTYARPVVDEQQDIFDLETSFEDGRVKVDFSRELFSEDSHDVNLQKCVYLLYTPNAGNLQSNGEINKHSKAPIISSNKVCLNTCSEVGKRPTTKAPKIEIIPTEAENASPVSSTKPSVRTKTTTSFVMPPLIKTAAPTVVFTPTEPVKARYGLWVRILNKEYVPEMADPQTEYYHSFTKQVTGAIDNLLAKRWKGMRVSKILGYSKGSVIAEFEVTSTGAVPRPIEVKSLVEENAIRGTIQGFTIEPSTVKAHEIEADASVVEASMSPDFLRQLIIIGSATVLLILAMTCAICLLCRCRSTSRYSSYPLPHPSTYPYGTVGGKKPMGFDNAAYHARHYSQANTASTKQGSQPSPPQENETTPDGVGETTYHEWYSKVGSKPASQQHEESSMPPVRPPSATPYVSYPNDPSGYYTLGGEHRARGAREQPKPFRY